MFLFFLLFIITLETKRVGLIIYYFFQSFLSLLLFMGFFLILNKFIFIILCAKLGLFPFFYWVVLVSSKIGLYGNIFILAFQKLPVFWLFWVVREVTLNLLFFFVYRGIILVTISLGLVRDLWLLLVYSSISNTGILLVSSLGCNYMVRVVLYLLVIVSILIFVIKRANYFEILLLVLLFLVVPPFVLFFIKFFIIIRLERIIKLGFYIFMFDVFILFYYFTFIFIKFILFDRRILIYYINYFIILLILFLRNYVALIIFY